MKEFKELITDKNFLLRVSEFIICIIGVVIHRRGGSIYMAWGMYGWLFISLAFIVAYLFEKPNMWTEIMLLVVYIIVMLIAAWSHLGVRSIMAFIAAALMIIDVILLCVEKK